MAAHNVGNIDIIGCVDNETAVLHLAANAQERKKANTRFDNDLLFVLFHNTAIIRKVKQRRAERRAKVTSASVMVTTEGATATLTSRHWSGDT